MTVVIPRWTSADSLPYGSLYLWRLSCSSVYVVALTLLVAGGSWRLRWSVSLLTWLVGACGDLSARRCSSLSSPDGLMACYLPHRHFPSMACMGASGVDSYYLGGGCLSRQLGALPSSLVMWLIRLKSGTQVG